MIQFLKNRNAVLCDFFTGFLISFCLVFGQEYGGNNFRIDPIAQPAVWGKVLCGSGLLFFLIAGLWIAFDRLYETAELPVPGSKRFISFGILLLGWIPYWLAAYPGFFTYDAEVEFVQGYYNSYYTKQHPILHILLIGKVMKLSEKLTGGFQLGMVVLSWLEMFIGAAVFTYCLDYLRKRGCGLFLWIFSLIYMAFFPTIAVFSMCSSKDVLFSLFFLLFLVVYMKHSQKEASEEKKIDKRDLGLFFCSLLFISFRNNALYAFLLFIPLQFWINKKGRKKRTAVLILGLITAVTVNTGIQRMLNCAPSEIKEMMSVPLAQLARVYQKYGGNDIFTQQQFDVLSDIGISGFDYYDGINMDPVKNLTSESEFKKHFADFIKLWIEIGLQYPTDYADAFLQLNYPAYYPFCDNTGYSLSGFYDTPTSYFWAICEPPVALDSKLPKLYDFIWKLSREWSLYKIPVAGILFTVGFHFLLFLFAFGYLIYAKKNIFTGAYLLIGTYLITAVFGPIVLVRYFLILFYTFPLTLFSLRGEKIFSHTS